MEGALARLSILVPVVTGTAAFVLTILAYRSFRGSPFGTALLALLPVTMLFTSHHALLLVFPSRTFPLVEAVAFTGYAGFALLMVRLHQRMSLATRDAAGTTRGES